MALRSCGSELIGVRSRQVFYVIQGAVKVAVHQSSFIVATGGMFWIPRGESLPLVLSDVRSVDSLHRDTSTGNLYNIQNVCERDAKLFFTQVRSNGEEVGTASGSDRGQRIHSESAMDGVAAPDHL